MSAPRTVTLSCPAPAPPGDRIQLGHGSGGKLSARLLGGHFLPRLWNPALAELGDAAILSIDGRGVAFSTDSYVVRPLEFPGGNIGALAIHGTLNDLAMMGAQPHSLSAGFILEEGLPLDTLDRIVATMAGAAEAAGVPVVTGDTKVVERGKADGMFINTAGLGMLRPDFRPSPRRVAPGDAILVSGPIGSHGMAIMSAREGLGFDAPIESDTAYLGPLVDLLQQAAGSEVHAMRDPTRGGVASVLNEIATASGTGMELDDRAIPVPGPVRAACDLLGLDPLYVANEGVLVAFVGPAGAADALSALRSHPLGEGAAVIGHVTADHAGLVVLETGIGGRRVVDLLPGDQLPRIC